MTTTTTDSQERNLPVSARAALATHARLARLRLTRGHLRFAALVLLALPVVLTGVLALDHKWGRDLYDNVLELHFRFLLLFLPALATSQAVAEEIEEKTFTFLFARPAPRWTLLGGKYLATTLPLALGFVLSITLSFVIALLLPPSGPAELVENLPALGRTLGAALLGVGVFAALSLLMGTWMTRHPFVAMMGYLLLVEGLLGSLPLLVSLVAMSWHLRNLAGLGTAATAIPAFFGQPLVSPWISLAVVAGVTGLALAAAAATLERAEYRTDR